MRFKATATDIADFTRALRIELGLTPNLDETDRSQTLAVLEIKGDDMMDLMRIATERGAPIIIWKMGWPVKLHQPADMLVFQGDGDCTLMRTGFTLWAGLDAKQPLLLIDNDGRTAARITGAGLLELPAVPIGVEASIQPGIERAMDRISDRLLALGSVKNVQPMAA